MAALAIPIEVQEQSLSQSTVILQVKFGLLGDSRKVSASQVEVDTDKQLLRVAKKILVSAERNLSMTSRHPRKLFSVE